MSKAEASGPRTLSSASFRLWSQAYEALESREKDLLLRYEKALAEEIRGTSCAAIKKPTIEFSGTTSLQTSGSQAATNEEVIDLIKDNLEKAKQQSKTMEVIDNAAKVISFGQAFVTSALSSEPHAALAWAGVSIFLPVCALFLDL